MKFYWVTLKKVQQLIYRMIKKPTRYLLNKLL